ncbi:MAG: hypothetical protein FJ146_16905 [Deltaproteobacteria bacterium]|nr:hypothetical protein [Deltaproteobacteria bacterium]
MKSRISPLTAGVCLTLAVALSSACGKKSSSSDDKGGNGNGTDGSYSGVNQKTDNDLVVTGQLAISTMALTDTPKGVLAFTAVAGEIKGQPQVVDVDSSGNFRVPIKRSDEAIKILVEEAGKSRDQRNWERMYEALRQAFPDMASKASLDDIKQKQESEIQEGVGKMANESKNNGAVTILVAYDKTGDKVSEAASFRFISLPTPENKPLSAIPNERLKGDVGLGKITGSSRDVTSATKSKDAIDLSDNAMESLADAGRAMKNVINSYMNQAWKSEPFYFWKSTQGPSAAVDQFSDPAATSYKGYGFYIGSEGSQGLTKADVCGGKSITFTPPTDITVVDEYGNTSSKTAYNNSAATSSQNDPNACVNNGGYYAREDNYGGQTSFMLNFGTGGSIASTVKGLWRMKVDATEVARYDFDTASPVADGKPLVPVASAKFTTSGGLITGVEVQLYRWNGSSYVKIDDLSGFKRLVSTFKAGFSKTSGGDFETTLKIGEDNKITGVFNGNEKDEKNSVLNPPFTLSEARALVVYYVIGNASYRLELR